MLKLINNTFNVVVMVIAYVLSIPVVIGAIIGAGVGLVVNAFGKEQVSWDLFSDEFEDDEDDGEYIEVEDYYVVEKDVKRLVN